MSEHVSKNIVTDKMYEEAFGVLPKILPEDFKNHWVENLSNEEYHADKYSVSSSSLRKALVSAASFYAYHVKGEKDEETDAMRFGTLAHLAVLEPGKFKEKIHMMPDFGDQRVKKNKEAKAEFILDVPSGSIVCTEKEAEMITGIVGSILAHDDARNAIRSSVTEMSGYYRDPATGLSMRFRPDVLNSEILLLADLKTTKNGERNAFSRQCWENRLDVQIVMYMEGFFQITGKRIKYPSYITVEKVPPYETRVYVPDDAMVEIGQRDYRKAVDRVAEGIKTGLWPRAQHNAENLSLPSYAFFD